MHHENTEKLVKTIAEESQVDWIAKGHPDEKDMKKCSGFRKRITLIFEQKGNGGISSAVTFGMAG